MDLYWLTHPIPLLKLKYSRRPKKGELLLNGIVCEQCDRKNIRVGSGGTRKDGTQYMICEDCAIDNYRYYNGFSTRKSAEAHRRRIFDVQYLFLEMLTDIFLVQRGYKDIEELSSEQEKALMLLSQELYNSDIPKSAKLRLEEMEDQEDIAKYLKKKLKKVGIFLAMIP